MQNCTDSADATVYDCPIESATCKAGAAADRPATEEEFPLSAGGTYACQANPVRDAFRVHLTAFLLSNAKIIAPTDTGSDVTTASAAAILAALDRAWKRWGTPSYSRLNMLDVVEDDAAPWNSTDSVQVIDYVDAPLHDPAVDNALTDGALGEAICYVPQASAISEGGCGHDYCDIRIFGVYLSPTGSVGPVPWSIDPTRKFVSLRAVMSHEFGHALGLAHSSPTRYPSSIMNESIEIGLSTTDGGPSGDDMWMIHWIYGL